MSAVYSEKILVIDDEPVIVEALRRVLTSAGFKVIIASDAERGLELVRSAKPSVVVIDIRLPGMTGVEFLPLAREIDPRVVTVLMSGFSSSDHVVLSLQAGAFTFLAKPFTFEEARNVVMRAARYHRLPAAERRPRDLTGAKAALFGVQGWCRVDPDGIGYVGVTEVYLRTMGRPSAIHAPPIGYPLMQGDMLVRIEDTHGNAYIAWSALGGRVLEINRKVVEDPLLLLHEPTAGGWLARLQAATPDDDLERLRADPETLVRATLSGLLE
jgi:CheY-like chemotaxis protein